MRQLIKSKWTLTASMLIMLWVNGNFFWGKDNWKGVLESDAKGYYAYLPAIFIYHDLNFGFLEKVQAKYPAPHLDYDYRMPASGAVVNKYFAGTAVLELPFFLIAHGIANLTDYEADGYSRPYLLSISLAALFYLGLGLYYLRKSLLLIEIKDGWISLVLLSCLFGSNLFVYSVVEPGMSHVFSFALMSTAMYQILAFKKDARERRLDLFGLLLGLLVLIRPTNMLMLVFLPFLLGSFSDIIPFGLKLIRRWKFWIYLLIPILIQPFLYYLASGTFWLYSYGNESFDFTKPHFIDILFSYKKGLFLYTPIYLISILSAVFMFKQEKLKTASFLIAFLIITYVFSSWWMWYYGGSFSSRVYVEYLPFFMLMLAYFIRAQEQKWKQVFVGSVLGLTIILCQIQTFQYRYYIIHYSDMTKELYWDNFLKLSKN